MYPQKGARLPQVVVEVSQLPTDPLLNKLLADKAVSLKQVIKFPTASDSAPMVPSVLELDV